MTVVQTTLDPVAETYVVELVARLGSSLGDALVGAWLVDSGARGDYIPGDSDIDVAAAVSRRLTREEKDAVVARCRHEALACPTRGLELVLYVPSRMPAYELNLNGGPGIPFHVSYEAFEDEPHWFVVDLACARDGNRRLLGPPFEDVFPPLESATVHAAVEAVLDWQAQNEASAPSSVLNACRAWRFAEDGVWSTKTEAAEWARDADPELVDAALALRRGGAGVPLDPARVRVFIARALEALR